MIGFIYFYVLIFYKHVFCKLKNPLVSLRDSDKKKIKDVNSPQGQEIPHYPA